MKLKKWLIRQTENLEQIKKMQKKLIILGLISLIGYICTGFILAKFPTYFWVIALITCTIGFTISALLSGVFFLIKETLEAIIRNKDKLDENKKINVLFSDSKYNEMIGLYIIAIPIGIVNAILMIFIFRSDSILIITFNLFLYMIIMMIVAPKLITVFSKKLQDHFKR